MSLEIFPAISPSYTLEEINQFRTNIIKYGNLKEQRISLDANNRYSFRLTWSSLSIKEKEILQQFFIDRKGADRKSVV